MAVVRQLPHLPKPVEPLHRQPVVLRPSPKLYATLVLQPCLPPLKTCMKKIAASAFAPNLCQKDGTPVVKPKATLRRNKLLNAGRHRLFRQRVLVCKKRRTLDRAMAEVRPARPRPLLPPYDTCHLKKVPPPLHCVPADFKNAVHQVARQPYLVPYKLVRQP